MLVRWLPEDTADGLRPPKAERFIQTERVVGWVRAHLAAEIQRVEGIIVAHEQDRRLAYAVAAVPGLSILTYSVDFALRPPTRPTSPARFGAIDPARGTAKWP